MLETTCVGSFPKPDELQEARNDFRRGKVTAEELAVLERKHTEFWVRQQERIGLDILVHGEMERGDMVAHFADAWDGFEEGGLVRSYGNRYYRKPIIVGEVSRPSPTTVEMWKYAQSLTDKPVKGMLTGPYTMMDWSFVEHYPDRQSATLALAGAVRDEARDLVAAGCRYIQIDEPALSTRPHEIELAIEAMGIVTDGLDATTISHICYGDFASIYPRLLDLPVDVLDLEFANRQFSNLDLYRTAPFTKGISVGVIDVHSHVIEDEDTVVGWIKKALDVFEPEKMWIDPDCGMKTRTVEESIAKLEVMVSAVRRVKSELGID
jgi:5-methyltetrahydropteroyltriglutamate--homocysteine methyltransferase